MHKYIQTIMLSQKLYGLKLIFFECKFKIMEVQRSKNLLKMIVGYKDQTFRFKNINSSLTINFSL